MASMSYRGNTTTAIANGAFSDAVPQPPLVIAIPASQKPQNSQTTETPQTTPSKTTPTHPIKATPTQTPQTPQTQTQTPNAQTANAQTKPRTHRVSPLAALVAKICNVLFFTILLVIILGAASLLTAQALGYTPLAILSGSMEPNYHVNGLVLIDTNANVNSLTTGDVIAFNINEATTVTHRVTAVDSAARVFTTQGDANNMEDAPVPFDNVIGRAILHVPWVGYLLMNLKTLRGLAVGALVLAVLVALFVVPMIVAPSAPSQKRGRQTGKAGTHFRTDVP